MKNTIRIALGNLWEHKAKTLILGLLVCFGLMLIVLGTGFLEAAKKGIEKDFRSHYTGDIVIHGPSPKKGVLTLFGVQENVTVGEMPKTPALPDAEALLSLLDTVDGIQDKTRLISGMILLSSDAIGEGFIPRTEDESSFPMGFFLSGDENYFTMFPDVKIIEGEMYNRNEPSLIMDLSLREKFETYYRIPLAVGDMITLQGYSAASAKLREVKIAGFFAHPDPNTTMMSLCYLDQNTARALGDLTYGSVYARDLPQVIDTSLSTMDEDDLFADMFEVENASILGSSLTDDDVDSLLGDTSLRDKLNEVADGAWQFVVLKLDRPEEASMKIIELNALFAEKEMNVKAIDWKTASSGFAMGTDILGAVFTILIVLLSVVVFIVIMNTLIISVIERTSEIGTMRALGAHRGFIRKLIFTETTCIVIIASLAGIVLALIISGIINISNIRITNETAKLFLGGGSFKITPNLGSTLAAFFAIFIGASLANLYPVSFALKITPLKAMNQED